MGCGEFLVKYILFFANLAFALAGLTLLGIGVAVQLQVNAVVDVIEANNLQLAPITAMVIGGAVFLIAFFGCCGAIRESNCMLVTYSIFMLLLMIAKLTLAILIFVKLDDVVADIPRWLSEAFSRQPLAFQDIERAFSCCGPSGAISYLNVVLPDSCCASTPCTIVNAYSGCDKIIQSFFNTFGLTIGIVAIIVVSIELVAIVFGLCLANHVRNKARRGYY